MDVERGSTGDRDLQVIRVHGSPTQAALRPRIDQVFGPRQSPRGPRLPMPWLASSAGIGHASTVRIDVDRSFVAHTRSTHSDSARHRSEASLASHHRNARRLHRNSRNHRLGHSCSASATFTAGSARIPECGGLRLRRIRRWCTVLDRNPATRQRRESPSDPSEHRVDFDGLSYLGRLNGHVPLQRSRSRTWPGQRPAFAMEQGVGPHGCKGRGQRHGLAPGHTVGSQL